jgi:hypothetical protein
MAVDNFGRPIEADDKSTADIKAMLQSLMQGKVGNPTKPGNASTPSSKNDEAIKEVVGALEKLNVDFSKELAESVGYLNQIVNVMQAKSESRGESKGTQVKAVSEMPSETLSSINQDISNLAKHALKKGSIYVHDVGTHKLLAQVLTEGFKLDAAKVADVSANYPAEPVTAASETLREAPAKQKRVSVGLDESELVEVTRRLQESMPHLDIDEIEYMARSVTGAGKSYNAIGSKVKSILEDTADTVQKTLFGLGKEGDLGEMMFGGVIDKEVEFIKNSRAAAYEVGGITSETRGLQKEFSALDKSAYLTGFGRNEMQQEYLKNVKSGIKDMKVAKAVTVAQLQIEKQLGVEAGSFSDTFQQLNIAGRMSVNQIGDMARGMKEAARNAGVSGEKLKSAMDSAREITSSMAKSATLTSAAAKNVVGMLASAEKFGVGDKAKELMAAASSSTNLLLSASEETKNLLYNAAASVGRVGDLQKGILTRSKAGLKDLRKGFDNILKTFGVESTEAIDNLSDESKMMLNIQLKSAFGVELGELRNQIDAIKEQEMGLADKMAEINKKRKDNLTTEEKIKLLEEERYAKTQASLGALTALEEAAKGAKDMNQALKKFGDRKGEFEADIKTLGGDFKTTAGAAKTALTSAIDNVNEGLRKAGKAELEISSTEISKALKDPAALREITAKITKGNQELETAQKAQLDPMSSVEQSAKELNDMFRSYSSAAVTGITDLVGNSGMMLAALSTMAVSQTVSLGRLSATVGPALSQIYGYFKQSQTPTEDGAKPNLLRTFTKTATSVLSDMFDVESIMKGLNLGKAQAIAENTITPPEAAPATTGTGTTDAEILPPPKPPAPPAPKTAPAATGSSEMQATLELMLDEMNAVRQAVKNDLMNVEVTEKFYKFWKQETKKVVKSIMHCCKIQMKKDGTPAGTPISEVTPPAPPAADTGEAGGGGGAPAAKGGILDFLKDSSLLEKAGDALLEYGPMLALMAAGLVAVATAIIAIMNKVFQYTGLDLGTAVKTAAAIGVILGAAAAIAAATVAAYKALAEFEPELAKLDWKKAGKVGAKLAVLAIGLSALAIGVIYIIKTMADMAGLDIKSIAELGGTIAGVVGAVVAIGKAIEEAVPALIQYAPILDQAKNQWKTMAKGALALIILAPALVGLSLALLKIIEQMGVAFGIDFNKAVEIGYLTAAILGATAAIALGVIAAMAGLWALGWLASGATFAIAGFMLLGAAALMVFAPAVVALGISLLTFINEMGKSSEIDAAKAYEVGELVSAILWSSAQIAVQTIAAMAGLFALGQMATMMWATYGWVLLGAAALMVFAPAVVALGMGLLTFINEMGQGFDITADKAYEIGELVSAVLWASGQIAVQTIAALGGLYLLGKLAKFIPKAIKEISYGAGALMIFAPAVFLLGSVLLSSIGGIAEGLGITPEFIEQTGQIFTAVLNATGNIVQQMIPALLGLALLGAVAKIMWFIIPFLLFGIGAFIAGMGVFTTLAMTIASFGYSMQEAGIDLDTLTIIDGMVWTLQSIFQGIAASLQTFSDELIPLFDGFLWFNSVADNILKIIPDMQKSFGSIVAFFNFGMLRPMLLLPSPAALKFISEILEPLPSIFKSIAGVLKSMAEDLVPLFTEGWIFSSIGTKIKEAIPAMRSGLLSVFDFLDKGIIDPVFNSLGNPRDIKIAAEALDGVAKMIPLVPQVVNGINKELAPLLKPGFFSNVSKLDRAEKTAEEMGDRFAGICIFIDKGIVQPIFDNIGNPRDVKIAAEALEGISKMLPLIPEVVNGISKHLKPLVTPGWWSKTTKLERVDEIIADIGDKFADICQFVDKAIVDPIFKNIGNPRDVKIAAEALEGVAKMLPLIPEAINGISKHLKPLTKKGGLFGGGTTKLENIQKLVSEIGPQFANIFKFIDQAIVTPIFENIGNPRDIKIAAEALVETNKLLELLPLEINKLATNLTPLSTSLMSIAAIDLPSVDVVVETMSRYGATTQMITMLPQILSDLNSGMTKINELGISFDADASTQKVAEMMSGINQFITNGLDAGTIKGMSDQVSASAQELKVLDASFKSLVQSLESIAASMNKIGAMGGNAGNINPNGINAVLNTGAPNAIANKNSVAGALAGGADLSGNMGAVTAASSGTANTSVSPVATGAITDTKIQQQIALNAATAATPTTVTGGELGDLTDTASSSLEVNQDMRDLLGKILTSLSTAPASNEAVASPLASTPKSGNTFNLTTGRFGESSAVGVTNL